MSKPLKARKKRSGSLTRQRILKAALARFAQISYEEVGLRDIALFRYGAHLIRISAARGEHDGRTVYTCTINLQGPGETVFLRRLIPRRALL